MEVGVQIESSLSREGSSDASMENSSSNVMQVKKLLSRKLLIGIEDGRFFLGTFYCLDKQGNIILQDAVEFRSTKRTTPSPMEQRCLGLILIPSSCRTSCHVEGSLEEQSVSLSVRGTSFHMERSVEEQLSSLSVKEESDS
ncbi:RNA splicing factor [Lithospermum erythrorhizon]|uniref:RNA splicing factor n=1 Tax=Lithospermum erythrorhizon TaxID=34254 RepID=A0AAV3QPD8_LITER